MVQFLGVYTKIAAALFLPMSAYVFFLEKELWKKVAILAIAMLLLPQVSAEYKLVHMFIPFTYY